MRVKRELLKNGRKIMSYIDTKQENGKLFYDVVFGSPSQTCVITWRHKTYDSAKKMALSVFHNVEPKIVIQ